MFRVSNPQMRRQRPSPQFVPFFAWNVQMAPQAVEKAQTSLGLAPLWPAGGT